jgi:hypothetical protein
MLPASATTSKYVVAKGVRCGKSPRNTMSALQKLFPPNPQVSNPNLIYPGQVRLFRWSTRRC